MNKNTLIIILIAVVAFLAGITLTKSQTSKNNPNNSQQAVDQTPTPAVLLAVESLKKYASELGLDTQKFNQCLDSGEKSSKVAEDVSLASSLKVQGTPGFFINGRFFGGAFPFSAFKEVIDKELAGKGSSDPKAYSLDLQKAAIPDQNGNISFNPKPVKVEVTDKDSIQGPANAKVTIVEFSDFQCSFCVKAFPVMEQVLSTYKNQIRFVYKQLPLVQIHSFAQKAAEASLCAADQGKFWEYYTKLFEVQSQSQ